MGITRRAGKDKGAEEEGKTTTTRAVQGRRHTSTHGRTPSKKERGRKRR